jgi:hypothetical protein
LPDNCNAPPARAGVAYLVPVILGEGIRLFADGGPRNLELEGTEVTQIPAVTHLGFKVHNQEIKERKP